MENHKNVLAQSCGIMQNLSCKHCDEGFSLFTDCVLVPRHLKDACTNCYYNSSEYHCSFHLDAKKRKHSKAATTTTTTTNNTDIKKSMEAENPTAKKAKKLEQEEQVAQKMFTVIQTATMAATAHAEMQQVLAAFLKMSQTAAIAAAKASSALATVLDIVTAEYTEKASYEGIEGGKKRKGTAERRI
ncbi:predicted protein [Uncinocarpus reesii 1704]|uniref:Uncharacterized protein n=1 Tax=Uncinocarpus reesii (strain UAMH 1704) TaxID=336963 RepID=C4JKU0_UNCRE|nr:uncharacterized protein UREG_00155 [Uncinocarpus reesii 1704]EEP75309.1 predicted protein [Uncinocarpus reesii 1704]